MNDNVPQMISMPVQQARLLADAGNLLTEVWTDLHTGELTYAYLGARMRDCGLAAVTPEGQPVLVDGFCEAVIGVSVALDHIDDDRDGGDGFEEDVEAAEDGFADLRSGAQARYAPPP